MAGEVGQPDETRTTPAAPSPALPQVGASRAGRPAPRFPAAPLVVALATLLATATVAWQFRRSVAAENEERFRRLVETSHRDLADRLEKYVTMLVGGAGLFAADENVGPDEFRAYVERLNLGTVYPGIQGIGWTGLIRPGERDATAERMRAAGFPDFRIWPDADRTDADRTEAHAILYLVPLDERNRTAIGYDMSTDPTRRAAMDRARDLGVPAASGRVTLVQETDERKQAGFLVYVPVYRGGGVPPTLAERRDRLLGYVYAPFRVDDLLAGIFGERPRVRLEIFDGPVPDEADLMHRSEVDPADAGQPPGFRHAETFDVAGRPWTVRYHSRPEFETRAGRRLVWTTVVAGALLALALGGLTWTQARAETDLRASERRLRFLNEASDAARPLSDPGAIMAEMARLLGSHLAASRCAYAEVEPDGDRFSIRHDYVDGVPSTVGDYSLARFGPRALADLRAGRTLMIRDVDRELAPAGGADMFNAIGIKAIVACPLVKGGRLTAIMAVHQTGPRDWQPDEVALVEAAVERSWAYLERARAESAVKAARGLLQFVADAVPALISYIDADGRYRMANKAYEVWFGRPRDEMIGRHMREVVGEAAWEVLRPHVEHALSGRTVRYEAEAPYRDGGTRWIEADYTPDIGPDGRVLGFVVHVMDLTGHKRLEEALKDADRRKDQFLATLAHELRNPLAPISNALEAWPFVKADPAELDRLRETMSRQVGQMKRLIDDLLDVSRITRGKITLRRERTDLRAVLDAAIEGVKPLIETRRHRLMVAVPDPPPVVDGDVARLVQVFSNLIHNAAKYTGEGGDIRVSARVDPRRDAAVVEVTDDGPGIPSEMLAHIFDMFVQVDQTLDRAHGGLGIGLTLVKTLVDLHGGTVEARSEGPGTGSTFTVSLPLALPEQVSNGATEPVTGAVPRYRILVVDDVRPSARTLALMLKGLGQETQVANDGPAALAALDGFDAEVALLDIAMPGMDGYELCRRIRERPGRRPLLVALTGYGQEEDRRRAFDAGFDRHLVKPTSLDALKDLLAAAGDANRNGEPERNRGPASG